MKKIVLSNELLLSDAAQLLSEGKRVIIPVKGCSMHPFIVAGRDCVELHPPVSIHCGDIVLAKIEGRFILHRVILINENHLLTLMGDGNLYQRERCKKEDVVGIARFSIRQNDKKHALDSPIQQWIAWLWRKQPVFFKKAGLRIYHLLYKV